MGAGLVDAIGRGWRAPRAAMAAERERGLNDGRALVHLMLACGIFFVASLPNAVREARRLGIDDAVEGAVSAHLFAWLALAPLLAYAGAAVVHLVARGFGARGGFLAARAAVFWSLLLAAPLALAVALAGALAEIVVPALLPWLVPLGYAVLAAWVWFFAASLAETEGFGATGPVAAVVAAAFAAVAALAGLAASA
jgi:hypothetical protein